MNMLRENHRSVVGDAARKHCPGKRKCASLTHLLDENKVNERRVNCFEMQKKIWLLFNDYAVNRCSHQPLISEKQHWLINVGNVLQRTDGDHFGSYSYSINIQGS